MIEPAKRYALDADATGLPGLYTLFERTQQMQASLLRIMSDPTLHAVPEELQRDIALLTATIQQVCSWNAIDFHTIDAWRSEEYHRLYAERMRLQQARETQIMQEVKQQYYAVITSAFQAVCTVFDLSTQNYQDLTADDCQQLLECVVNHPVPASLTLTEENTYRVRMWKQDLIEKLRHRRDIARGLVDSLSEPLKGTP